MNKLPGAPPDLFFQNTVLIVRGKLCFNARFHQLRADPLDDVIYTPDLKSPKYFGS